MNAATYLHRIGCQPPQRPDFPALAELHTRHLAAVPFENLDIHLGRPIELDLAAIYHKIVERRRGGFCYELNGLFAWLLDELGFTVHLWSAQVWSGDRWGADCDHLTLGVELEQSFLADVGFGDSFARPLPHATVVGEPGNAGGPSFRWSSSDAGECLQRLRGEEWVPLYRFGRQPRRFPEFAAMCRHHQTSPESHFTRQVLCSRPISDGRVTLAGRRLVTTRGGSKSELVLAGPREYQAALRQLFEIELSPSEATTLWDAAGRLADGVSAAS